MALWIDRLVAGGCVTPLTLASALRRSRVSWRRWPQALALGLSGVAVEPLAWLQALLYGRALRQVDLPSDPVIVIGHWRSGTTYLHQLLAADPQVATARNALTIAPQVALLLKSLLVPLLGRWMSATRPIDAVPWGPMDPQEDEIGLARLSFDTNMAGVAFPQEYPFHFRRCVLSSTPGFRRQFLHFCRLTLLHEGSGKSHWLIKNSAHSARVPWLLALFPRARFVLLQRDPVDSVRSLVQVKQTLADLVGLQAAPDVVRQVEETASAHRLLLQAFDAARAQIPAGQLLEVPYDALMEAPLATVERIYSELSIAGWQKAKPWIAARVQQAKLYRARPVQLEPKAEKRLQALMQPAAARSAV